MRYILTGLILLIVVNVPMPTWAGVGDLMVAPTRVLLKGRKRTETVNLVNRGSKTATYRITLKNQRMHADGSYEDITLPDQGERFADDMIRYSPRQVTLKPGEVQTVRLMVRKPLEFTEGEYRSHMLFQAVPPKNTGDNIESSAAEEGKLSVKLIPVFGVSIPVIVQHGTVRASAAMKHLKLKEQDGGKLLVFDLLRDGNASLYGDVDVQYRTAKGDTYILSQLRGVSVLHPYPKRSVAMRLTLPEDVKLDSGTLEITYRQVEQDGGALLSQASYPLP